MSKSFGNTSDRRNENKDQTKCCEPQSDSHEDIQEVSPRCTQHVMPMPPRTFMIAVTVIQWGRRNCSRCMAIWFVRASQNTPVSRNAPRYSLSDLPSRHHR